MSRRANPRRTAPCERPGGTGTSTAHPDGPGISRPDVPFPRNGSGGRRGEYRLRPGRARTQACTAAAP